jgi:glycosyltransferase involved in cell wall biosynthesis
LTKLLIISHVFWEKRAWKRWQLMTQLYSDIDVTLLAPRYWIHGQNKNYTFGKTSAQEGVAWEEDRFRVRLIDMRQSHFFDWLSFGLINEIRQSKPDMVYYIGNHLQYPLVETILATKLFAPKAKITAFSMRGLPHRFDDLSDSWKVNIIHKFDKLKWKIVKKNCDAIFCHYPHSRLLFLEEGFTKPVYIQTQIGVDSNIYQLDEAARKRVREKYKIGDSFVFGSATRFSADKGLFEILRALPPEGNWRYLMLGSGTEEEEHEIHLEILKLGIKDKVITPGFISWSEMPDYWSAMDCALHVPKTTTDWVETFSLALVQAMSSGLPVIGNNSGSVPYQLGEGIIVPEGDVDALRDQMIRVMNNYDEARRIGALMRQRVLNCFDIVHLSHCFYSTMQDIVNGVFNPEKTDMADFSPRNWDVATFRNS